MSYMSESALDAEQQRQQQAQDESAMYNDCLIAMADAMSKGVSVHTLQTMKYQMSIDAKDYQRLMDFALVNKFQSYLNPILKGMTK